LLKQDHWEDNPSSLF